MSMRQAMKRSREEAANKAKETASNQANDPSPPLKRSKKVVAKKKASTYQMPLKMPMKKLISTKKNSHLTNDIMPLTPKKAAAAAAKKANQAAEAAKNNATNNTNVKSSSSIKTETTIVTEHTFDLISRNDYSLFTEEQHKKLCVLKKRDVSKCICHEQNVSCEDGKINYYFFYYLSSNQYLYSSTYLLFYLTLSISYLYLYYYYRPLLKSWLQSRMHHGNV